MKMRLPKINKYVGTLIGAVVLGILAVLLIVHYLHKTKNQYQQELESKLSQGMAQVVVPTANLPAGTLVNGSNMAQRLFPRDLLYPDTITTQKWSKFAGRALRRPVQAGKPLLAADFNSESISEFAALLKDNHRAVTISVDDINSISGMIQPGDRIDVMMLVSGNSKTALLPLLHYVRVLATGGKIFNPAGEAAGLPKPKQPGASLTDQYSTLTLELTPEQASDLMVARKVGSLKIALSPQKLNPGAPTMPLLTGKALEDRLSGVDQRPRMRGVGGIQFIIGSTQGVSSSRTFAGMAPVKPAATPQQVQAQDRAALQRKATEALSNLINADMPANGQSQPQSGQSH